MPTLSGLKVESYLVGFKGKACGSFMVKSVEHSPLRVTYGRVDSFMGVRRLMSLCSLKLNTTDYEVTLCLKGTK